MPTDSTPGAPPHAREVADALAAAGAPQGPADAHGMLCALLCADPSLGPAAWLETLGASPNGPIDAELRALHARTGTQLAGERFDLAPWLPDDNTPLDLRVRALGEWCQGFLSGLGLAGVDPVHLSADAAGFVNDLAAIALATHDDQGQAEEAERDYTELVEFLRIGTYLVHDALQPPANPRKPG